MAMALDLETISDVRVFVKGVHRPGTPYEKEYTSKDLEDVVRNFKEWQSGVNPIFRPPAVIGHEEENVWGEPPTTSIQNTGTPRWGTPKKLRTDGMYLYADISGVPRSLADLIRNGQYDSVSCEIYDSPPPGVPGRGRMLRRIAFLGGMLPEIKSMADVLKLALPSKYTESPYRATALRLGKILEVPGGAWACFSEVIPMPKPELLAKLTEKGLVADQFKDLPDAALESLVKFAEGKGPGENTHHLKYEVHDDFHLEHMSPEQGMESLRQSIGKYAEEGMKRYGAEFAKHCAKKFSEGQPGEREWHKWYGKEAAEANRRATEEAGGAYDAGHSSEQPAAEHAKFSEERRQIAAQLAEARQITKDTKVEVFCERLIKTGHIIHAMMDHSDGTPGLADLLSMASDAPVIRKFSENGQDKKLEFNLCGGLMNWVEKKVPNMLTYGEKMRVAKTAVPPEEKEVEQVEAHFDSFAEQFEEMGVTKQQLVDGFKADRKSRPKLTALEFLNVGN
jgi:hypothetical protein